MNSQDIIENQAKQTLGTLSLAEYIEEWEGQTIPKANAQYRISQTARTKERKYRITSKKGFPQSKAQFIPKKIKIDDNSSWNTHAGKPHHSSKDRKRNLGSRKASEIQNESTKEKTNQNRESLFNVNLLQYWVLHRKQKKSMSLLISKIQENRKMAKMVKI